MTKLQIENAKKEGALIEVFTKYGLRNIMRVNQHCYIQEVSKKKDNEYVIFYGSKLTQKLFIVRKPELIQDLMNPLFKNY